MENRANSANQLIAEAYQHHCRSVFLYIFYKIGKEEDAKDLCQDVFLRLLDYKSMLRPETVTAFIHSISRNLVTDYLRHHYIVQEANATVLCNRSLSSNETESRIIARDLSVCEMKRVSLLPPQRQKVYMMSRFGHQSPTDISQRMGLSVRTVENHLSISRKEVREYVRKII